MSQPAVNHPLAGRMAVIAFLNQNLTIGCLFGSFSVLLAAVEARLGVGRDLSTLGVPAMSLVTAICAPVVGLAAARFSLRTIMTLGSLCSVCGYLMLAVAGSLPVHLIAYALLLGPAVAIGVILPATLTTNWFTVHRGRAMGLVHTPVAVALVPLATIAGLASLGLSGTYVMLAAICGIMVVANLFVRDRPPAAEGAPVVGGATPSSNTTRPATSQMSMGAILHTPRFWAFFLASILSATGSIILSVHLIPMAQSWGIGVALGAVLLTIQSIAGIGGTILFGWLADRIGGAHALAIVVFDSFILWMLLLLKPSFPVATILFALIGLHGAGALPAFTIALSQTFGQTNFSRAYGLSNMLNLPFSVLCVPIAAIVFTSTGSYDGAIIGQAALLLLVAPLAWLARTRGGRVPPAKA